MTMRLFVAFSVLGVFCLPAFSQYGIFADIPFVFGAGERTLAAGRYRLDSATTWSPAVMTVTAVESRERIFLPTSPAGKGAYKAIRKDGAQLVFHRYGDRYFLSQIYIPANDWVRRLPVSKSERELARISPEPKVVRLVVRNR